MLTIAVILGVGVLSISFLQPILPLYLTSINVSPEMIGLMLSTAMVGMVIGETSWGWVADKVGLKTPMGVGTLVCSFALLLFVITKNIPAIFLIFFFWGLVRSALFGPGRGYIAAHAPSMKKATFLATITVMMSVSRSLGALPSGIVVDNLGYDWVFYIASGIAFLGGIIVLSGLKNKQFIMNGFQKEYHVTMRSLEYRTLSLQCIITFLQFSGVGLLIVFLPLFGTHAANLNATEVGILFTIRGLTTMFLGIPMGVLADRMGKKVFMTIGLLVSAAAMACLSTAMNFLWLAVFAAAASLGLAMFSPAALGLVSESVPLHRQGTAMGIYGGVCENVGIIAGSSLGGFIWIALGPRMTFLMGAVAPALGALLCPFLFLKKSH